MRLQFLRFAAVATLFAATAAQASVEISAKPTKHMHCASGTCTPTAKSAVLNATDLANMLSTSDVTVMTDNGAVTITISAPFQWASTHHLTLDATLNVAFRAPVEVTGQGAVTITTNHDGTGGDLLFFPGGKLDFWDTSASFTFNGTSYVLVNDIASMAAAYAAAPNNSAVLALAKDYDAAPDGTYQDAAISIMEDQLEGLGHTISNFSASGTARETGFISQSFSGIIRDLTLSNASVSGGTNSLAGLLGGALAQDTTIINVHASGSVSAGDNSAAGGLVGYANTSEFFNSDSSANVTCTKRCLGGGLVGQGGQFFFSHASGTVTIASGDAGGLVGFLSGTGAKVSQSFATGDVVSAKPHRAVTMGGLAGLANQDTTITDSYATGAIRNGGSGSLGGLIGSGADNSVATSYATGRIGTGGARKQQINGTGGFIGSANSVGPYTQSYWNTDTSGTDVGCGGSKPAQGCPVLQGLTDTQLKSSLPAGFDPKVWAQKSNINNGYPYLIANPPQ
jgi:hypothetical protein